MPLALISALLHVDILARRGVVSYTVDRRNALLSQQFVPRILHVLWYDATLITPHLHR